MRSEVTSLSRAQSGLILAIVHCTIPLMSERCLTTRLATGERILLRPVGRHDRARLRDGIAAMSDHSRYLRFFTGARTIPDEVIDRLVDVDGQRHIAWGAIDLGAPGQPAIGVVHAIRKGNLPEADLALGVLDAHHAKGIARLLLTAVVFDCRVQGIDWLEADTLAENSAARRLFRAMGGVSHSREGAVVKYRFETDEVAMRLAAMGSGQAMTDLRGMLERRVVSA